MCQRGEALGTKIIKTELGAVDVKYVKVRGREDWLGGGKVRGIGRGWGTKGHCSENNKMVEMIMKI